MSKGQGKLRIADEPVDCDGCMTFEEIGKELGMTRGGAWMTYCRAIRKLRKKKVAIERLREILSAKDYAS